MNGDNPDTGIKGGISQNIPGSSGGEGGCTIDAGDLVTLPPDTPTYSWAFSSVTKGRTGGEETHVVALGVGDLYVLVILPSGERRWVHMSNCRPARKADRT